MQIPNDFSVGLHSLTPQKNPKKPKPRYPVECTGRNFFCRMETLFEYYLMIYYQCNGFWGLITSSSLTHFCDSSCALSILTWDTWRSLWKQFQMVQLLVTFADICPGTDELLCLAPFIPTGCMFVALSPPSVPPVFMLLQVSPLCFPEDFCPLGSVLSESCSESTVKATCSYRFTDWSLLPQLVLVPKGSSQTLLLLCLTCPAALLELVSALGPLLALFLLCRCCTACFSQCLTWGALMLSQPKSPPVSEQQQRSNAPLWFSLQHLTAAWRLLVCLPQWKPSDVRASCTTI